jgi:hypothetical protein
VPALFPHTAPQQPDRRQGVLFAEFHLGETEDVLEVSDNGMVTGWCTPETRIPRVGPTSSASRRDRETWLGTPKSLRAQAVVRCQEGRLDGQIAPA